MAKPIPLGPWPKGLNNRLDAQALPADALRNAVNVDLDDTGRLKRRAGRTRVYEGTIEKDTLRRVGELVLFIEGGNLKMLTQDYSAVLVRPGVGSGPLYAVQAADEIFYSTPSVTGKFGRFGHGSWGVRGPAIQPRLTASTNGSLEAGAYQVAVTFQNRYGEESGTGLAASVTLESQGGIVLDSIPQPAGSRSSIRVYCSHRNGGELFLLETLPAGTTDHHIVAINNLTGPILTTQFLDVLPPGGPLAYLRGRLFVAQGNVLWHSAGLRYGLHRPDRDFFAFAAPISIVAPVTDGLYIVAERTFFLQVAHTLELTQVSALPYGATPGTLVELPDTERVAWWSHRGLIKAGPGGKAENMTEQNVSVGTFERGAMTVRESNGLHQFIASLQGGVESQDLADDYRAAEIARKGNTL